MSDEKFPKTVHQLAVLGAVGGNILDWFLDRDVKRIALYGNDELVALLYEQAFWKNIEIKRVWGDSEKLCDVHLGVASEVKQIKQSTAPPPPGVWCVLCGQAPRPIHRGVRFGDLYSYSLVKKLLFDRISGYKRECAPALKVVVLCVPSLHFVRNKSEYERSLIQKVKSGKGWGHTSKEIYSELGFDEEYEVSVNRGFNVYRTDGVKFLSDFTSKYCNCTGGYRLTADVPEKARRTVYFFGNSVCIGMKTDDAHTIPSVVQRALNARFPRAYKVLNCGSSGNPNYDEMWNSFAWHRPKNGDAVVLVSWFSSLLYEQYKDEFLFVRPQADDRLFDRPHDLGEYIWTDAVHYSHIGYAKLGEYLADKMVKSGVLDGDGVEDGDGVSAPRPQTVSLPLPPPDSGEAPPGLVPYLRRIEPDVPKIGAIVMNCNPFTLGHRHLAEYAAAKVASLILFVVEEDKSMFSFADRIELVRKGTADIKNITVVPSGGLIISRQTFGAYFEKALNQEEKIDPSADALIFARHIAKSLGVTVRFAGEEPTDKITRQYNETLSRILPQYGVEFHVIPRKECGGAPVSASRVRKLLEVQDFDGIAKLVPQTTYEYLVTKWGGGVKCIKELLKCMISWSSAPALSARPRRARSLTPASAASSSTGAGISPAISIPSAKTA
jgi:[citrate (pro-3S)-lyase] ligase